MTHQALGQAEQARDVLTRAEAWTRRALSDEKDRPVWNRRLTLQLLQQDANDVIGGIVVPSDADTPAKVSE